MVSLANQTQLVYGFANPDERIDEDCAAAFPGAPWKCLFGAAGRDTASSMNYT